MNKKKLRAKNIKLSEKTETLKLHFFFIEFPIGKIIFCNKQNNIASPTEIKYFILT